MSPWRTVLPASRHPAPPSRPAVRPDPTRPWYVRVLDSTNSRTCLALKGFTETKKRRSTGRQPGTKGAPRPVDRPVVNRLSTGDFVLPSVYIGFCFFVLPQRRSRDVSSTPWGVRGTLVSWACCLVGVPFCPAPPRRPAVRPDPTRPWYVQVCAPRPARGMCAAMNCCAMLCTALYVYVYVCVCVCMCVYVSEYIYVYVYVCMCV